MKSIGGRARPDLDRSAVARYLQLASLFRRRIEAGQWPVGHQIPTVDELAAECGVARATIRQALDQLAGEDLIERYRAKGTFVCNRPAVQSWCEVATDWSGLLLAREAADIKVVSDKHGVQPTHVQHPVGTMAPSYRRIRRLHSRKGVRYYYSDLHIDERLSAKIGRNDLLGKPALRLIADIPGVRIKDARQTVVISTADVETAHRLDIALNAPVAIVYRSVVDGRGCLVFIGEGIYRGDMFRIEMKLK
jgi:GntR family transcriptional regulator